MNYNRPVTAAEQQAPAKGRAPGKTTAMGPVCKRCGRDIFFDLTPDRWRHRGAGLSDGMHNHDAEPEVET